MDNTLQVAHYLDEAIAEYKGTDNLFIVSYRDLDLCHSDIDHILLRPVRPFWYMVDKEVAVLMSLKHKNIGVYTYDELVAGRDAYTARWWPHPWS